MISICGQDCTNCKYCTSKEKEEFFEDKSSTQDLVDRYAFVSNQFWKIEDDLYDYEEGSLEYARLDAMIQSWKNLLKTYEEKIFAILRDEGIEIPATGQITVLEPFMKRYYYRNDNGWWIKESKKHDFPACH